MAGENVLGFVNGIAELGSRFFEFIDPLIAYASQDYLGAFKMQRTANGAVVFIKEPGYPTIDIGLYSAPKPVDDYMIPFRITEEDVYSASFAANILEEMFDITGGAKAFNRRDAGRGIDNYLFPSFQSIAAAVSAKVVDRLKCYSYLTPIDTVDKLDALSSFSIVNTAASMASRLSLPTMRAFALNSQDGIQVANSMQNNFNSTINKNVTNTGWVGNKDKANLAGMDCFVSNSLGEHIAGPLSYDKYRNSGVPIPLTISNVSDDGTQITISGAPANTTKLAFAGDKFSCESVKVFDKLTKRETNYKFTFNAVNDAYGDGAGNVRITVQRPLRITGYQRNINVMPAIGAQVKVYPDRNLNFILTRGGLQIVPLMPPDIQGSKNSSAVNSGNKKMSFPVKAYAHGDQRNLINEYRFTGIMGSLVLSDYVIEVPTAAR